MRLIVDSDITLSWTKHRSRNQVPVQWRPNFYYIATCLDHYTRRPFAYLLKRKIRSIGRPFNYSTTKSFAKLDMATIGVYCSAESRQYYMTNQIRHQTIVPYESEPNESPRPPESDNFLKLPTAFASRRN
uniref:Uncharacterized protein n=1 Tax=Spongospora subterranea TaxID=70186 RepID=A0A0H5QXV3_9EUKA|eukprot:CRZ06788.1 hypothetical protein [Spongospora subterranea]